MKQPAQAVLKIYIPKQGFVEQGKFCLIDEKPCFVANMTERKLFRNFGGYAIAKRVLDSLPRGTKIIYKRLDLNVYYTTNKTRFQKKGILVKYGQHSQWILPLKNWKTHQGKLQGEPTNLPVMKLQDWKRGRSLSSAPSFGAEEKKKSIEESLGSKPRPRFYDLYDLKREWETKYA